MMSKAHTLKNNIIKRFLCCLCAMMLSACTGEEQHTHNKQELAELTKSVAEMRQELQLLTKEVVNLNSAVAGLTVAAKPSAGNQPPTVARVTLTGDSATVPMLGSSTAKYALIEFMDYQCPYCLRHARQTLPKIKSRYIDTGQLRYAVRDYPLSFHAEAKNAAIAAKCAAKQGKFWEMHDALINNAKQLGQTLYNSQSATLGMDIQQYSQCLSSPEAREQVDRDMAYGNSLGVRGTPRFYLGKVEGDAIVDVVTISGAHPFEYFDKAIQRLMAN